MFIFYIYRKKKLLDFVRVVGKSLIITTHFRISTAEVLSKNMSSALTKALCC